MVARRALTLRDLQRAARGCASKRGKSEIEEALAFQIRALKLPAPVREHAFHPERKWRFDFAWPAIKVAVECEGGVWTKGRHTRGQGFIEDCRKYAAAALAGWLVLRVTGEHLRSGEASLWIEQAHKGASR